MALRVIKVLLQIVGVYFVSAISFIAVPLGNGWELPWLAIVAAIATWGVSWLLGQFTSLAKPTSRKFLITLVGGFLGVAVILLTPATGLMQILYPAIGALIAYYLPL